eukprot:5090241-Pleurochrysis_carterae.AAC.3
MDAVHHARCKTRLVDAEPRLAMSVRFAPSLGAGLKLGVRKAALAHAAEGVLTTNNGGPVLTGLRQTDKGCALLLHLKLDFDVSVLPAGRSVRARALRRESGQCTDEGADAGTNKAAPLHIAGSNQGANINACRWAPTQWN